MKNKLCLAGLIGIMLVTYSCSNEDSYDNQEVKARNFQINPEAVLKVKNVDSTAVKSGTEIITTTTTEQDGDPNNPIPPR
jgi:hypothetical protein